MRVVLMQLAITLAAASVWLFAAGARAGLAAAAGGGISTVLSLYVAVKVFLREPRDNPGAALAAFYRAQAMKLLLAVVLISLAILGFRDHPIPLVTTLAATLGAYWLALLGDTDKTT
ncbi:ATP synthase subunit I [Arhodomonas aquaeolei]|uniref:ATP synthase subunit I n=1 Tax=Arhodomonas aquaeolei TaxID=2369 RepID=UPI00146D3197|nr:ATP synthase subunit I [Arhodomonas aquaeolei]